MSLQLKGRVTQVLPIVTGEGKNGTWKKQSFIMEYMDGTIAKKVCITCWGDKTDSVLSLFGCDVTASLNIESREYNGKWYTDITAWKVETNSGPYIDEDPDTTPATSGASGEQSDLPF